MERQIQRPEDEKKTREACEAKQSEADMCCNMAFKGSNFTEFGRRYGKSRTWVKASRSKTNNAWLEGQEAFLEPHRNRIREAGGCFAYYDNVRFDAALHTFTMQTTVFDVSGTGFQ